jgi:hypothetical protein
LVGILFEKMQIKSIMKLNALCAALICFATIATHAQQLTLNGSFAMNLIGRQPNPVGYSSSSLEMGHTNYITSTDGAFTNLINYGDEVLAYTNLLSSISSSSAHPTVESITNYLVFSAPFALEGGTGSTPANRFVFDLSSIYTSGGTYASFYGSGTVIDKSGTYAPTVAQIILSFSSRAGFSGENYSLSFDATGVAAPSPNPPSPTPEPGTIALAGLGAASLGLFRHRK